MNIEAFAVRILKSTCAVNDRIFIQGKSLAERVFMSTGIGGTLRLFPRRTL
jgi:hypothetical protein